MHLQDFNFSFTEKFFFLNFKSFFVNIQLFVKKKKTHSRDEILLNFRLSSGLTGENYTTSSLFLPL